MEEVFKDIENLCRQRKANVHVDSRKVECGDVFVAVPGESVDGADFIAQAVQKGASHIVCAREAAAKFHSMPGCRFIIHDDPRDAVWRLASAYWHTGDLGLRIAGITGTNGKTTTSYLLEHIFTASGHKVGVIGTVSYRCPAFSRKAPLTTPGPIELHSMLAEMAETGVDMVIMEVSSHALAQQRVNGIPYAGAVFTNLTQDHLDFHKDMESYFRAKARLFLDLPKSDKPMAINADDSHGRRLMELLPDALSYGLHGGMPGHKHLEGKILSLAPEGMRLRMSFGDESWEIRSPLVGEFNASNLLAAQGLALGMGLTPQNMGCLESFHGVSGRLERVANNRNLNIFVDYAHTPDALENALKALRASGFHRIITVFGCGGNRDRGKRPLMGVAVSKYSDVAILTSDNPRFEDPEAILLDVKPGLTAARSVFVEVDRRKATAMAIELLGKEDALLIAGKGHEDYQIIQGEKLHYSDQEVVRELINCA